MGLVHSPDLALFSSARGLQGKRRCTHEPEVFLQSPRTDHPSFCGLCMLTELWEDEVPRRIHAYKLLAENGNPEVSPQFYAHFQASLGLKPPKPGENLKAYRLARGRLYGKRPLKSQFPLLSSLWMMMGTQPKLAQALILSFTSHSLLEIAAQMKLSPYGANLAAAKGVRMALRELSSKDR